MTYAPHLYRRRRWPTVLVVLLAIVVMLSAGAAAVAMWQAPGIVPLTPGAGSATNDTTPTVSFRLDGLGGVQQLRVEIDGRDVSDTLQRDSDTASVTATKLADGAHTVAVSGSSRNPLRDTVARTWQFTVDTVAPKLTVDEIAKGKTSKTTTFTGTTEPGATVTAPAQGKTSAVAAENGRFALEVPLKTDGAEVEFVATDRAGNATRVTAAAVGGKASFMLTVDPTAKVLKTASPAIGYAVASATVAPALSARIDGRVVYSTLPAELSSVMSSSSVPARTVSSVLKLHKLAQGRHELQFSAMLGGQTLTVTRTFVVNSTEKFGAATLLPGAIGADVKQLQKLLARTGFYKGARDGVLGDSTVGRS